jgi:hypothetical protein
MYVCMYVRQCPILMYVYALPTVHKPACFCRAQFCLAVLAAAVFSHSIASAFNSTGLTQTYLYSCTKGGLLLQGRLIPSIPVRGQDRALAEHETGIIPT